jgi:hypothetical protein
MLRCIEIWWRVYVIVDTFSERQILKKNRRRCSLVRRGWSAAWGRTVRDLAQGLRFPAWRPDDPRPGGQTVHVCAGAAEDRRRRLDLAPGRDPVEEERS